MLMQGPCGQTWIRAEQGDDDFKEASGTSRRDSATAGHLTIVATLKGSFTMKF